MENHPVRSCVAASLSCLALLLFLALGATSGHAGGLYTGEVPVATQGEADRNEALKNALAQVVMRVSGDSGALAKPELAKAVAGAERYVQQYQYQQEVVTDAAGQPQIHLTLVAEFDHNAVDELLRGFGLLPGAATDQAPAAGSVAATSPGAYRLWVGGVRSALDYARMMGALTGNEWVQDVHVELARGDGIELRVATVGALPRLLESLNGGAVLHVTNAAPPVDGLDALLELKP
jgi:hypothetical protein